MNSVIEIDSVTKVYRSGAQKVFAVKDVSLSLKEYDYIAVVGPSGAGKSTVLHILGGLETPTRGEVVFNGKNIYKMKDKPLSLWRNSTVGFVFQFFHLIEELNILENVAIASFQKLKRKSSLKNAQELLKYLGIEERRNFFPSQLSGGEKQKAAIARALINDPQIVLCDEPTGNLDKDSQSKVIELLEELNREKGKIVVLVTHNLELAKRAKKVILMEAGELRV